MLTKEENDLSASQRCTAGCVRMQSIFAGTTQTPGFTDSPGSDCVNVV